MRSLADGDRDAFAEVFRAAKPLVERYLGKVVSDAGARDELVQATLLKAFEAASSYDPDRDAATWILALASWEVRSHRRDAARSSARVAAEASADGLASDADPERDVAELQIIAAVRECLGELSPSDQDVVLAAMRGERPEGATFRKRLERALGRLKSKWSARYGQDVP